MLSNSLCEISRGYTYILLRTILLSPCKKLYTSVISGIIKDPRIKKAFISGKSLAILSAISFVNI
jgi:hypothetical protein